MNSSATAVRARLRVLGGRRHAVEKVPKHRADTRECGAVATVHQQQPPHALGGGGPEPVEVGVRVVALVLASRKESAGQRRPVLGVEDGLERLGTGLDRGIQVERCQGAAQDRVVLEACQGRGELGLATTELTFRGLVRHLVLVEGGEAGEVPALHELGDFGDELGHVLDTHLELGRLVDVAQAAQPGRRVLGLVDPVHEDGEEEQSVGQREQSCRATGRAVPLAAGVEQVGGGRSDEPHAVAVDRGLEEAGEDLSDREIPDPDVERRADERRGAPDDAGWCRRAGR